MPRQIGAIVLIGGKVVGYVTVHCQKPVLRGQVRNLAVAKAHRGEGIGRRLIARALEHFRQAGMEQARIETLATNPVGQRLYPSMGFQEVARQIHYAMRL
jgi:ribosomal protein S18 acetylase RimI-like enzyme